MEEAGEFQLTRPWEGATGGKGSFRLIVKRFNSRARGRARQLPLKHDNWPLEVSTHAPVGGRDRYPRIETRLPRRFNSRARGRARYRCVQGCRCFNSRARGRARLARGGAVVLCIVVSTHAPVGGRDYPVPAPNVGRTAFQLTRPWEGATSEKLAAASKLFVSTHAPVGGRDPHTLIALEDNVRVSTHAPVGGRDSQGRHIDAQVKGFQLTRPWEGATCIGIVLLAVFHVSTHAPVGGRDMGIGVSSST